MSRGPGRVRCVDLTRCCGRGTTLAVANKHGMDAVGVDNDAEQCRHTRALTVSE